MTQSTKKSCKVYKRFNSQRKKLTHNVMALSPELIAHLWHMNGLRVVFLIIILMGAHEL